MQQPILRRVRASLGPLQAVINNENNVIRILDTSGLSKTAPTTLISNVSPPLQEPQHHRQEDLPITTQQKNSISSSSSPTPNSSSSITSSVYSISFSPDGLILASAGGQGRILLHATKTGRLLFPPLNGQQRNAAVYCVAFSPQRDATSRRSYQLASAGDDGTVRLYCSSTGKLLPPSFLGHTDHAMSVSWLPDGSKIVSGSYDKSVLVFDVATRRKLFALPGGHSNYVLTTACSADGRWVASGGKHDVIRVWSMPELFSAASAAVTSKSRTSTGPPQTTAALTSKKYHHELSTSNDGLVEDSTSVEVYYDLKFSSDSKLLVSASADASIRVWSMELMKEVAVINGAHAGPVRSIALAPQPTEASSMMMLASAGNDNTLQLWSLELPAINGKAAEKMARLVATHYRPHSNKPITCVAFAPAAYHADGGNDAALLSLDQQRSSNNTNRNGNNFFNEQLVATSSLDGTAKLFDVITGVLAGPPIDVAEVREQMFEEMEHQHEAEMHGQAGGVPTLPPVNQNNETLELAGMNFVLGGESLNFTFRCINSNKTRGAVETMSSCSWPVTSEALAERRRARLAVAHAKEEAKRSAEEARRRAEQEAADEAKALMDEWMNCCSSGDDNNNSNATGEVLENDRDDDDDEAFDGGEQHASSPSCSHDGVTSLTSSSSLAQQSSVYSPSGAAAAQRKKFTLMTHSENVDEDEDEESKEQKLLQPMTTEEELAQQEEHDDDAMDDLGEVEEVVVVADSSHTAAQGLVSAGVKSTEIA